MSEQSKVAIVVGASGGIGSAVAVRLARDGFSVVAHYAGNSATVETTVKSIVASGGKAVAVQADVGSEDDVKALFKTALAQFGRIDVVVHTAGIMPMSKIIDGDMVTFDKVIATNLRGTYLVMSQSAQHVADGGRIIAFSSSVLAKSFPAYGPYIASKAGIEGLVRVLANELRGRNITVNAVAPGPTGTELFLKGKTEDVIDDLARLAPLERIGSPEDIAATVSFLAGADGGWVNAQIIRSNGGFA
ncbi:SDR family oxidoreductase [Phyllobacterium endophyticum]|uniref:SDR family oxidoreductase n=1 Tax=Phyllobacterium endophyticum TaxID=1149773 RepID=UPI0011C74D91|nr:SDR family oxidoreductase [Phyllobacterium endophyticum]TXR46653.1 SDR family oxidoreductase [Phyllobacterium endophyticum]